MARLLRKGAVTIAPNGVNNESAVEDYFVMGLRTHDSSSGVNGGFFETKTLPCVAGSLYVHSETAPESTRRVDFQYATQLHQHYDRRILGLGNLCRGLPCRKFAVPVAMGGYRQPCDLAAVRHGVAVERASAEHVREYSGCTAMTNSTAAISDVEVDIRCRDLNRNMHRRSETRAEGRQSD